MNKKLISIAVLAGVSGAASAMNVNPDGIGQVLLYPYYTTNNGLTTNIQVVNTTGQAKAVKVRFSEGVNTWEVLDFNLYLSPYDVWSGGVSKRADGTPALYTSDTSCTVPQIPSAANGGVALKKVNITTHGPGSAEPTTVSADERLTEGHLEIIEMGNVANVPYDLSTGVPTPVISGGVNLFDAIEHDQTQTPATPGNCAALSTAWLGMWRTRAARGMTSPTGGLFGSASIINVANGIERGYDAVAISAFFDTSGPGTNWGIAHSRPGNSFPNLNGEAIPNFAAGISSRVNTGSTSATIVDAFGNATTANFATTIDALTAALSVETIANQFYTDSDFGGATDWVVSFPTKHYYVNPPTATLTNGQYGVANKALGADATEWDAGDYVAPFANGFDVGVTFMSGGTSMFFNREEKGVITDQLQFSPSSSPNTLDMNKEVNVLQFGSESVLGSHLTTAIDHPFKAGWAQINFTGGGITATNGTVFNGLPAIGFATTRGINSTLGTATNSVLANYAALYQHKYTRRTS